MKKNIIYFILVALLFVGFFVYDVAIEAIQNGYSFGFDYNYDQGTHGVHVELEPIGEHIGRLNELPVYSADNVTK